MEYILCFLDTRAWAGRLCYRTTTQHKGLAENLHNTHFTQIPYGHNVSIPGPHGVMLVLLDENSTSHNSNITLPGGHVVNIYPGSQLLREFALDDYQLDITNTIHGLLNNFGVSANNMCQALEWMEGNLCCDMAFHIAFSLAAELSASLPESPTLEVNQAPAHRYTDPLSGAWTIGVHNLHADNPRHI